MHISFIYFLSFSQLFWLHKCTATGKRVAMQGCHQSARYLLDAHLLGTSHLRLASSISHLTHPALSCPQGGPRWPLPFRTELRFPASQFVSVCVFVCSCRPLPKGERERERVFHEFSLSFPRAQPAKYSLLIPGSAIKRCSCLLFGTLVH